MSNQEAATILLIDDHPMLRTGVKQLISMRSEETRLNSSHSDRSRMPSSA